VASSSGSTQGAVSKVAVLFPKWKVPNGGSDRVHAHPEVSGLPGHLIRPFWILRSKPVSIRTCHPYPRHASDQLADGELGRAGVTGSVVFSITGGTATGGEIVFGSADTVGSS
jgi:hypothetical protein